MERGGGAREGARGRGGPEGRGTGRGPRGKGAGLEMGVRDKGEEGE